MHRFARTSGSTSAIPGGAVIESKRKDKYSVYWQQVFEDSPCWETTCCGFAANDVSALIRTCPSCGNDVLGIRDFNSAVSIFLENSDESSKSEIEALRKEVQDLKNELTAVRFRNKTLADIVHKPKAMNGSEIDNPDATFNFVYRNYKTEITERHVRPIRLWYGHTPTHKEDGWFLCALDVDKDAQRDFYCDDILAIVRNSRSAS